MAIAGAYPVTLAVDYPEQQSRWKTLLRLFLAIPVLVFLAVLSGGLGTQWWPGGRAAAYSTGATGAVLFAIWITIVLRARIPHWLFDFEVALLRWEIRAFSYFALLTDTYPPFEGDYPIRFEVQYPERLARWKVLVWKAITSIPHMVILLFLSIGAFFAVIAAWFAILFTGRFPRSLHGYVAGVMRWGTRVQAYFLSLTDEYPPFSLSADAGPPSREIYMLSSIGGWLVAAVLVAAGVAGLVLSRETVRVEVPYDDLTAGRTFLPETSASLSFRYVSLIDARDPAQEDFPLLVPQPQGRLVAFRLRVLEGGDSEGGDWVTDVKPSEFRLRDGEGKWHDPLLAFVGESGVTTVLFQVEGNERPDELEYRPSFRRVVFEFE